MFVDYINGLFEFGGAIVTWINSYKIIKDKQVRGVFWPIWIFYTLWGFWNLYYYPAVNCWWSFVGGIFLVSGNTVWVYFAFRYRKK